MPVSIKGASLQNSKDEANPMVGVNVSDIPAHAFIRSRQVFKVGCSWSEPEVQSDPSLQGVAGKPICLGMSKHCCYSLVNFSTWAKIVDITKPSPEACINYHLDVHPLKRHHNIYSRARNTSSSQLTKIHFQSQKVSSAFDACDLFPVHFQRISLLRHR